MAKFHLEVGEMVFDDETTFRDGIYGLYKKRHLDPDRLRRSMAEEFEQNEGGAWLGEYAGSTGHRRGRQHGRRRSRG